MKKNVTIEFETQNHNEYFSQTFGGNLINVFLPLSASVILFSFICFFSKGFIHPLDLLGGFILGIIFSISGEFMLSVKPDNFILENIKDFATIFPTLMCVCLAAYVFSEADAVMNVSFRIIEIISGENIFSRFIDYEALPEAVDTFNLLAPFTFTYFIYCGFRVRNFSYVSF
ncbi:MAG: hypothetical protein LBM41_06090 [Ruminococcus sp.]|jgi:hypothetical protein|nr:hypothetical protein [Ruminococcus sp.]